MLTLETPNSPARSRQRGRAGLRRTVQDFTSELEFPCSKERRFESCRCQNTPLAMGQHIFPFCSLPFAPSIVACYLAPAPQIASPTSLCPPGVQLPLPPCPGRACRHPPHTHPSHAAPFATPIAACYLAPAYEIALFYPPLAICICIWGSSLPFLARPPLQHMSPSPASPSRSGVAMRAYPPPRPVVHIQCAPQFGSHLVVVRAALAHQLPLQVRCMSPERTRPRQRASLWEVAMGGNGPLFPPHHSSKQPTCWLPG